MLNSMQGKCLSLWFLKSTTKRHAEALILNNFLHQNYIMKKKRNLHYVDSFAKYKVAVSGFYKVPLFSLLYSSDNKAVMCDDTSYFIAFSNYNDAYLTIRRFYPPRK